MVNQGIMPGDNALHIVAMQNDVFAMQCDIVAMECHTATSGENKGTRYW